MERYIPVAHTRLEPPRVWLLFLEAGYKRAVLGTTILSNGKVHFNLGARGFSCAVSGFGNDPRNEGRSREKTSGTQGGAISVLPTKMTRCMYQPKFPEFWVEWKALQMSFYTSHYPG